MSATRIVSTGLAIGRGLIQESSYRGEAIEADRGSVSGFVEHVQYMDALINIKEAEKNGFRKSIS